MYELKEFQPNDRLDNEGRGVYTFLYMSRSHLPSNKGLSNEKIRSR